jgi:uncharacterized damage-inducible protein DinB
MKNPLIGHFRSLARYNTLANGILYAACARLSDEELKRPRPAFFHSIHGTLNHIVVGDRIWLARFAGREASSEGLDAILYEDFSQLRAAREEEDRRVERFANELTEDFLHGTISYRNHEGRIFRDPVPLLAAHFFNHQTHHRGQAHGLLSQTEAAPPSLDMHRVLKPDPDEG